MESCVTWLVQYCVSHGYVSEDQRAWLRYGIEKRLYTLIGSIPFFIIAVILTDYISALCFVGSFYCWRRRTNGFHAKTVYGCLSLSLAIEMMLLLGLYPLLTPKVEVFLVFICVVVILIVAPFNDKRVHFTNAEVVAVKKYIRYTATWLGILFVITIAVEQDSAARGLTAGTVMATSMLGLAYFTKWRKKDEHNSNQAQKCGEKDCNQHGNTGPS